MTTPSPHADRTAPADWDIQFTRLSLEVFEMARYCLQDLTLLLSNLGLQSEVLTRQTPRGVSTYVSVIGQRGLLCIFDFTIIDGMRTARQAGAALEVRLLDAEGDVASEFSAAPPGARAAFGAVAAEIVSATGAGLSPAVLLSTMTAHFCAASRRPAGLTRHASP